MIRTSGQWFLDQQTILSHMSLVITLCGPGEGALLLLRTRSRLGIYRSEAAERGSELDLHLDEIGSAVTVNPGVAIWI